MYNFQTFLNLDFAVQFAYSYFVTQHRHLELVLFFAEIVLMRSRLEVVLKYHHQTRIAI